VNENRFCAFPLKKVSGVRENQNTELTGDSLKGFPASRSRRKVACSGQIGPSFPEYFTKKSRAGIFFRKKPSNGADKGIEIRAFTRCSFQPLIKRGHVRPRKHGCSILQILLREGYWRRRGLYGSRRSLSLSALLRSFAFREKKNHQAIL